MDYDAVVKHRAQELVRQIPLQFVQPLLRKGLDPKKYYLRWPDDELSWLNCMVHHEALAAVDPDGGGMLRKILAASPNLDAFDPDGLMFDSSAKMLKYVALYAYKVDLWAALNWFTAADVLTLIAPNPPADAGKE